MSTEHPWLEHDIAIGEGRTLRVLEQGSGFPVLLLHGFPELGYSWRHQIPAIADAGYRVLAPNQRGYHGSYRPAEIEAYDLDSLVSDAVGLLDAIGAEQCVVIGHDWGSPVAWHMALTAPERVFAVGSLSVPHSSRAPREPLQAMREAAGPDHIFYIDYFQQPGLADAELNADPRHSLLAFMWSIACGVPKEERFKPIRRGARFLDSITEPKQLPGWLTEEDLDYYTRAFEDSGFTGGLNWYRNSTRNWQRSERLADARVTQPALFVTGSQDPARGPAAMARMREVVPDLRVFEVIEGCGHWTQQERPAEVSAHILRFLEQVVPKT